MPNITDQEVQVGQPTSQETIRKFIQITNFLSRLNPIGSIIPIDRSIPGVPSLDSTTYRLCDGTEIVDPNSPIASTPTIFPRNAPNLDGKHIRGALTTSANNTLGNATAVVSHSHGGNTGDVIGNLYQNVSNQAHARDAPHHHTISTETQTIPLDPLHKNIQFYIKIN